MSRISYSLHKQTNKVIEMKKWIITALASNNIFTANDEYISVSEVKALVLYLQKKEIYSINEDFFSHCDWKFYVKLPKKFIVFES